MNDKLRILFPSKMSSVAKRVTGAVGVEFLAIIIALFITKTIDHFGMDRISTYHIISTLIPLGYLFLTVAYIIAFLFSIWWVIAGFILLKHEQNQP